MESPDLKNKKNNSHITVKLAPARIGLWMMGTIAGPTWHWNSASSSRLTFCMCKLNVPRLSSAWKLYRGNPGIVRLKPEKQGQMRNLIKFLLIFHHICGSSLSFYLQTCPMIIVDKKHSWTVVYILRIVDVFTFRFKSNTVYSLTQARKEIREGKGGETPPYFRLQFSHRIFHY